MSDDFEKLEMPDTMPYKPSFPPTPSPLPPAPIPEGEPKLPPPDGGGPEPQCGYCAARFWTSWDLRVHVYHCHGGPEPHLPPASIPVGERERVAGIVDPWAMGSESRDSLTRNSRDSAMAKADEILAPLLSKVAELEGERDLARKDADEFAYKSAVNLARAEAAETALNTAKEENGRLREAMTEACDLLMERIFGSSARSAGHNARLCLQSALKTASTDRGRE